MLELIMISRNQAPSEIQRSDPARVDTLVIEWRDGLTYRMQRPACKVELSILDTHGAALEPEWKLITLA
jgi:hypothetical protein